MVTQAQVGALAMAQSDCCPICRGQDARFVIADGPHTLRRCRACEFLFVAPRPTAADLQALYCDEYFTGADMQAATLDYRAPVFEQCLRTLAKLLPQRGRLLDVGCWTGDFVVAAARAGWQARGIELSRKAADFAVTTRRLDVHCGTLADAPNLPASFDAVTFLDVLEHVLDPIGELERAHQLLRPGGVIAVRVPNTVFHLAKTRLCRLFRVHDIGLQMRYHINHFTPWTLSYALRTAGFEVIALDAGAAETKAHAPWAAPWAKRAYVAAARVLRALTGAHWENIMVACGRKAG